MAAAPPPFFRLARCYRMFTSTDAGRVFVVVGDGAGYRHPQPSRLRRLSEARLLAAVGCHVRPRGTPGHLSTEADALLCWHGPRCNARCGGVRAN